METRRDDSQKEKKVICKLSSGKPCPIIEDNICCVYCEKKNECTMLCPSIHIDTLDVDNCPFKDEEEQSE